MASSTSIKRTPIWAEISLVAASSLRKTADFNIFLSFYHNFGSVLSRAFTKYYYKLLPIPRIIDIFIDDIFYHLKRVSFVDLCS